MSSSHGGLTTPGGRRKQQKGYMPYNHDPKTVGTLTGRPLPTNITRDESGFEDVEEFFKSPTPEEQRDASTSLLASASVVQASASGGRTVVSATSRRTAVTVSTPMTASRKGQVPTSGRSRLGLDVEDGDEDEDDGERDGGFDRSVMDDLMAEDDASGEMTMDVETPNATRRTQTNGHRPPPSVSLPQSSRLAPVSPTMDFDKVPNAQASPTSGRGAGSKNNRQSIGRRTARAYTSEEEEPPAPAQSQRRAAGPSASRRSIHAADEDEEDEADESMGVEMGRRFSQKRKSSHAFGRRSDQPDVRGSAETEIEDRSEEDEAAARMALDPDLGHVDEEVPLNDDYDDADGGAYDDGGAGEEDLENQQDERPEEDAQMEMDAMAEEERSAHDYEEDDDQPVQPKRRGRPPKDKGKARATSRDTAEVSEQPRPKPRERRATTREPTVVLEPADDLRPVKHRLRTRAERTRPLEYWRNERAVYTRKIHNDADETVIAPTVVVQSWLKIPKEDVEPFAAQRKHGRSVSRGARGRSASAKPDNDKKGRRQLDQIDEEEEDGINVEGWDDRTEAGGLVLDYATGETVMRRIACPESLYEPKAILNASFLYQKVFVEDPFFASGILRIPVGGKKAIKPAKDNTYAFYVHKGAVQVTVHRTRSILSEGSQFLIPRGNDYGFENVCKKEVHLFFAQARCMKADEEVPPSAVAPASASQAPAAQSQAEQPGQIQANGKRKRVDDNESTSGSDPDQVEAPPTNKRGVTATGTRGKKSTRGGRK